MIAEHHSCSRRHMLWSRVASTRDSLVKRLLDVYVYRSIAQNITVAFPLFEVMGIEGFRSHRRRRLRHRQ